MPFIGQSPATLLDIDDDAITSAKIATDAVGSSEIAADAVGSSEVNLANDYNFTGIIKSGRYHETKQTLSGTTPTLDMRTGNVFELETSGNTVITVNYPPANGTAQGFTLKLKAGGNHTVSYSFKRTDGTTAGAVRWEGGAGAPTTPASGETDILQFFTMDGGENYYGLRSINAAG